MSLCLHFLVFLLRTWDKLQSTSDNYRGKLLETIGLIIVLNTILSDPSLLAVIGKSETELEGKVWADCKGVITHGNNPTRLLPQDQVHVDLILALRNLVK